MLELVKCRLCSEEMLECLMMDHLASQHFSPQKRDWRPFPLSAEEEIYHPYRVSPPLREINLADLFPKQPRFTPCGADLGFGAALIQGSHNPGFTPFLR